MRFLFDDVLKGSMDFEKVAFLFFYEERCMHASKSAQPFKQIELPMAGGFRRLNKNDTRGSGQ